MVDFKNMSRKEKIEYIWEYYKLYIIGAVILVVIAGSFIHGIVTRVDSIFNVTIIGNVEEDKRSNFQKQLTNQVVGTGDKKKKASVDLIPVSTNGDMSVIPNQYMQQIVAKMSAGELDILILDKSLFNTLAKQDGFARLDSLNGLDLSSIKGEKIEASGGDNNKAVYAISAKDVKIFKDMGIDVQNKVIGIITSSKDKTKSVTVLKWLLSK